MKHKYFKLKSNLIQHLHPTLKCNSFTKILCTSQYWIRFCHQWQNFTKKNAYRNWFDYIKFAYIFCLGFSRVAEYGVYAKFRCTNWSRIICAMIWKGKKLSQNTECTQTWNLQNCFQLSMIFMPWSGQGRKYQTTQTWTLETTFNAVGKANNFSASQYMPWSSNRRSLCYLWWTS
jgi:hypothetical protein